MNGNEGLDVPSRSFLKALIEEVAIFDQTPVNWPYSCL